MDEATATALENRAAEQGLSVAELVHDTGEPVDVTAEGIAELERRWQSAKGGKVVSHTDVVRWLRTWGKPDFEPWNSR